jgi:hypothetical protein
MAQRLKLSSSIIIITYPSAYRYFNRLDIFIELVFAEEIWIDDDCLEFDIYYVGSKGELSI